MAGLFRYNINSLTPKRRATLSPFSTSPGQLQDVTMENTYALGYRSPNISLPLGGNTSPGQGRSVREFEEQMAALRNENFNLKLRLYFLELKIPGYHSSNSSDGHESLIKQNVDLKVDIEVLKKELQQKQSILCEAAKALEVMEDQQKENEEKSGAIIEELNQKIQYLEVESKHLERSAEQQNLEQLMGRSHLLNDIDILQKVRELEGQVKQSEQKIEDLINKKKELEELLTLKEESCDQQEENIKQLKFQIDELQEQVDQKAKETLNLEYPKLKDELHENKKQLADKLCLLDDVEKRLKDKTSDHEKACNAINKLLLKTKDLQNEIDGLKKSNGSQGVSYIKEDCTTFGSESTALCGIERNDKLSADLLQIKLEKLREEKDAQISNLKEEVRKKTANLQNLVNKELWGKNREIERLTKLINISGNLSASCSPVRDVNPLQQSFTDLDYSQALDRNKRLQSKVDDLIQRLCSVTTERNSDVIVQQLKMEVREARGEMEKAERWRKECSDVCSILTLRLQELAGFLDSLLNHKDVLGALAADRWRTMRTAVDCSLELSRSLNSMSMSVSGMSMGEHSLEFLGNISNILDHSIENKENHIYNSFNNVLTGNGQIIESLRAEIKVLKKALEKKKLPDSIKKDRRSLPLQLENQSESEAWSEPDRNVSLARIGLEESIIAKNMVKVKECNSNGNTSTESETDLSRKCKSKNLDKISQLEQIISLRDNKILQVQCELVNVDNRLKKETLRRIEMSRQLDEYQKVNEMLEIEIAQIKQQTSRYESSINDVEVYRRQAEEKEIALGKLIQVRDQLNNDISVAQMKIESLQSEYEELKQKHRRDLEASNSQEKEKLSALQVELSQKYEKKLYQIEINHQEYLARDWISRIIYDETKRELEDVQKKFADAQLTIDYMRENESELNVQLVENEKSFRTFKKNLDEATLQSSKVILERTKARSEKLLVEQKLQQLTADFEAIKRERDEILAQNNLLNSKLKNTKSITKMNKQSSNGSDLSQSGYTSEDVPVMSGHGRRVQRSDNSSPDLGIESDAGRISSTDAAKSQALMSKNQLQHSKMIGEVCRDINSSTNSDAKNNTQTNNNNCNPPQDIVSITKHDCAKVDQENAELRRKLCRTKHALEETWQNLRTSNQRKEQAERDIRQQILKTQNVLKYVRTNMESELIQPKKESKQEP